MLPGNRCQAKHRALSLKSKFLKDSRFQEDYNPSLKNGIQGFAEKVPPEDLCTADGKIWYIPLMGCNTERNLKRQGLPLIAPPNTRDAFQQRITPDLTNSLVGALLHYLTGPSGCNGRCAV